MRFPICLCLLLLPLCWATSAHAQTAIIPTDRVLVTGTVAAEITLTIPEITAMPSVRIKDLPIFNHKGEQKGKLRGLRGVPLRTLLQNVVVSAESAKTLSEYYLTCEASDGYKVVFSWNEVFNSPVGMHTYILTSMDHKALDAMDQRIALITPGDMQTGRRYVKCLSKITFSQAQTMH